MLFDQRTESTTSTQADSEPVLVGFDFDWQTKQYLMDGGTPREVSGTAAIEAWLELVIRTAQGRYAIYPDDFGARLQSLAGRKIPRGMELSEFTRQLKDSARYLPAIQEVSRATYDGAEIHCTVTTETQEVTVYGP